ncbi:hypothetical protein [Agromyces sp. M3QZ16-3]|uniref:hypothetical protein n=1 Tax=Agromyces sp. M3QZ16-3 TaxID=3447585 RepID=UPI003F68C8B7
MPDARRIAELQRQAYGAGTDDDRRAAAAAELAMIRASGDPDPRVGDTTSASPTASSDEASAATHGDVFDDLFHADTDGPRRAGTTPNATIVRVAAVAAAVALAIGFAAGWATALGIAGAATEPDVPDSSLVFPLSEVPPDVALEDARAGAVFEREQAEADIPSLVMPAESMGVDGDSTRLLTSLPEGTEVYAGRAVDGPGICLLAARGEQAAASGCTPDDAFPGGEIQLGFDLEGDFITVTWGATGTVSVGT